MESKKREEGLSLSLAREVGAKGRAAGVCCLYKTRRGTGNNKLKREKKENFTTCLEAAVERTDIRLKLGQDNGRLIRGGGGAVTNTPSL